MTTYYVMKKADDGSNRGPESMVQMINLIPAFIYSAVFRQHFFPDFAGGQKVAVCAAFFVAYLVLSFLPYVSLITNVASTIMFVGMIWAIVNKIDNGTVRMIVKVVTAGFVGLLELGMFATTTLSAVKKKPSKTHYTPKKK